MAAIVATLLLTIEVAGTPRFWLVVAALIAITATLVVFFVVVLPVNKATRNWTEVVPAWSGRAADGSTAIPSTAASPCLLLALV